MPFLVHGTSADKIASILESGLVPGGPTGATGTNRNSVHLALYPISDRRCVGGLRKGSGINALVYLKKVAVIQQKSVIVTPGLFALVNEVIEPGLIHCITHLPRGHRGPEEVVWDSRLANARPWFAFRHVSGLTDDLAGQLKDGIPAYAEP